MEKKSRSLIMAFAFLISTTAMAEIVKPGFTSSCTYVKQKINELKLCDDGPIEVIERPIGPLFNSSNGSDLGPKEIVISLDDGPQYTNTECIRIALKKCEARAHFFMVGRQMMKNTASEPHQHLLKKLHKDGHILGMHSWSHQSIEQLFKAGKYDEVDNQVLNSYKKMGEVLGVITGAGTSLHTPFFRFPFGAGHGNPTLMKYLKHNGMTSFFWRMMAMDAGTCNTSDCVAQHSTMNISKVSGQKGIFLGHDSRTWTSNAMPEILHYLKKNDYKLVIYTDPDYLMPMKHRPNVTKIRDVK